MSKTDLEKCEMKGNFGKTLTAGDKYSLCNTEILIQPIQMRLSGKQRFFFEILSSISEIYIKFWTFFKKKLPL